MSGVKGQNGPLTLRCRACGARNCGPGKPIQATNAVPRQGPKGHRLHTRNEVRCRCGWTWWTTHPSIRNKQRRTKG